MFRSYGGPTQGNVTSQRHRYMTSRARPIQLPSTTAEPHPDYCYMNTLYKMHNTQSQLPVNGIDVVTSIATIGTFEAFFKEFSQSGWVWHDFLKGLRNFGGGGLNTPNPSPLGTPLTRTHYLWWLLMSGSVWLPRNSPLSQSLWDVWWIVWYCDRFLQELRWSAVGTVSPTFHTQITQVLHYLSNWQLTKLTLFFFLNEVIPLCINSLYLLYYIIPSTQHKSQSYRYTHAGSESYTGTEAHPLLQKKPATVCRRKLTKTRRKAITETKLQADTPPPHAHPPETKKREDGKTTTDITRTTRTTAPRSSTQATPQYTRRYNST